MWDRLFGESAANVDHNTTRLLLTDISTVVPAFETQFGEIVFETYQFEALHLTAGKLSASAQRHLSLGSGGGALLNGPPRNCRPRRLQHRRS